jgi:hypothetical protein
MCANWTSKHSLVVLGLLAAIGMQLAGAPSWSAVLTPAVIGGILVQIGTTLSALFVTSPKANGNG